MTKSWPRQTFEEIAKAQANVSETGLGLLSKSDFPSDALADYVFSQPDIGTLAPIEGDFGWVVFRLNAIEAEDVQPLEEVRETLVEEAALEKAIDQSYKRFPPNLPTLSMGVQLWMKPPTH